MKKIVLSLIAATTLLSCEVKKTNVYWRNAPWDIKLNSSFLLKKKIDGDKSIYTHINEKLCIGTEMLDSVDYIFYRGQLETIHLYYTPATVYHVFVPRYLVTDIKLINNNNPFLLKEEGLYKGVKVFRKISMDIIMDYDTYKTDTMFIYDSAGYSKCDITKLKGYFNINYGITQDSNTWHDDDYTKVTRNSDYFGDYTEKIYYYTLSIDTKTVNTFELPVISGIITYSNYHVILDELKNKEEGDRKIADDFSKKKKKQEERKQQELNLLLNKELKNCPLK